MRHLPPAERVRAVAAHAGLDPSDVQAALSGLDVAIADKMTENVLGTFALPFSVVVHLTLNQKSRLAPMVVEEPSVVAAASSAAKMVSRGGGFHAECDDAVMIAQVQLRDVHDPAAAQTSIEAARDEIVRAGNEVVPRLVARGGGVRGLEVRQLPNAMLVVHVLVDCRDAMGANIVNTLAEALGPRIASLARATLGLRILSNLATHRRVRVWCRVPTRFLATTSLRGLAVADAIEQASRFAEVDPYRAATHNKGIMNGVDPVLLATGNDWRAVEAGAHAYAALSGTYQPLSTWRRSEASDGDFLEGRLELPMAVGTVGAASSVHPGAQAALRISKVTGAADLGMLAAAVGLGSNLAALRALGTEGIQRGHMALHARSVAVLAGARSDEVEPVAVELSRAGDVSVQRARQTLQLLRSRTGATR